MARLSDGRQESFAWRSTVWLGGDEETGYMPMTIELPSPLTKAQGDNVRVCPGVGIRLVDMRGSACRKQYSVRLSPPWWLFVGLRVRVEKYECGTRG